MNQAYGVEKCLLNYDEIKNLEIDASTLVLLWGRPIRVLLVRKSCKRRSYWSCDAALPGGHLERNESPIDAALRESWEEAWIHPSMVNILGVMEVETTRIGKIRVLPVIGIVKGPLCYRPNSDEVDQVFWIPLEILEKPTNVLFHPRRKIAVEGYVLNNGAILWGATLRILRRLYTLLQNCSNILFP